MIYCCFLLFFQVIHLCHFSQWFISSLYIMILFAFCVKTQRYTSLICVYLQINLIMNYNNFFSFWYLCFHRIKYKNHLELVSILLHPIKKMISSSFRNGVFIRLFLGKRKIRLLVGWGILHGQELWAIQVHIQLCSRKVNRIPERYWDTWEDNSKLHFEGIVYKGADWT